MLDVLTYVLVFVMGYLVASIRNAYKEKPAQPDMKGFEIIAPRVKAYDKPSTKRKARIQTDQKAREYEIKIQQYGKQIDIN